MTFLAIDTATERACLVLFDEHEIICHKELDFGFMHSKSMVPILQEMVAEPQKLQCVAVGIGPGSYTGIRVGVASAKAISYARNIPLIGVSSLQNFCPSYEYEGPFTSAIDAKIGGVYIANGSISKGKVTYNAPDDLVPFDEFVKAFSSIQCIVTPSWEPIKKRLLDAGVTEFPRIIDRYPSPNRFMDVAKCAFSRGDFTTDSTVQISYLRGQWGS